MSTVKPNNTDLGMFSRSIDTEMGDHFKAIEEQSRGIDFIDPSKSFVIRVDGRAFHTFTRGMPRPFSTELDDWRNAAADAVLRSLKPTFAYHQSDEISYVWMGVPAFSPAIHPFNGRVDKLITLCASLTSTAFFKAYYDSVGYNTVGNLPHFDGRLAGVFDDQREALRCVMWRENDAIRNSVQMFAQHFFSHKELQGKNVYQQYEMCIEKGLDWKVDVEPQFRRGTYLRRVTKMIELDEAQVAKIPQEFRPDPGATVPRSVTQPVFFNDWNISTRLEVLVD